MVQWYHTILSAYGFWLPNDPRGSWSSFVASWELLKFGGPTKVDDKRSYAHDRHDYSKRLASKQALKYHPVRFDEEQRRLIGEGFARAILKGSYGIHACCIGYDHCHVIIARHERTVERIASHLKSKATMALTDGGVHPLAEFRKTDGTVPTPWSEGIWSVFIHDRKQLESAVDYVNRHPRKEGLPEQNWNFVVGIDRFSSCSRRACSPWERAQRRASSSATRGMS